MPSTGCKQEIEFIVLPQIALGSLVLKAEGLLRSACVVASPPALTSHMSNILVWSELQLKKQDVLIIKYMRYC